MVHEKHTAGASAIRPAAAPTMTRSNKRRAQPPCSNPPRPSLVGPSSRHHETSPTGNHREGSGLERVAFPGSRKRGPTGLALGLVPFASPCPRSRLAPAPWSRLAVFPRSDTGRTFCGPSSRRKSTYHGATRSRRALIKDREDETLLFVLTNDNHQEQGLILRCSRVFNRSLLGINRASTSPGRVG